MHTRLFCLVAAIKVVRIFQRKKCLCSRLQSLETIISVSGPFIKISISQSSVKPYHRGSVPRRGCACVHGGLPAREKSIAMQFRGAGGDRKKRLHGRINIQRTTDAYCGLISPGLLGLQKTSQVLILFPWCERDEQSH